jgi:hypothetical protein
LAREGLSAYDPKWILNAGNSNFCLALFESWLFVAAVIARALLQVDDKAAQVEIELQASLHAVQPQNGTLLVAKRDDLRTDAKRAATADRTIGACDVRRMPDVTHGALEFRHRAAEHKARTQPADGERVVMAVKAQCAIASLGSDEPATFGNRKADPAAVGPGRGGNGDARNREERD